MSRICQPQPSVQLFSRALFVHKKCFFTLQSGLWLLTTNLEQQLDVNFDYFISEKFQMFQAALLGIADAWLTTFGPLCCLHGSLNTHAVYFGMVVLLMGLIFDNIDFLLTYRWLKTHPIDYIKVCSGVSRSMGTMAWCGKENGQVKGQVSVFSCCWTSLSWWLDMSQGQNSNPYFNPAPKNQPNTWPTHIKRLVTGGNQPNYET